MYISISRVSPTSNMKNQFDELIRSANKFLLHLYINNYKNITIPANEFMLSRYSKNLPVQIMSFSHMQTDGQPDIHFHLCR